MPLRFRPHPGLRPPLSRVCGNAIDRRYDSYESEEYRLRCGDEIAADVLGGHTVAWDGPKRMRRHRTSLMVVEDQDGDHGVYCPACARDVEFCRVCGCTEEMGCLDAVGAGICHWVEPGLCSACWAREPIRQPMTTDSIEGQHSAGNRPVPVLWHVSATPGQ
jgi:hypothetical protein